MSITPKEFTTVESNIVWPRKNACHEKSLRISIGGERTVKFDQYFADKL
jgi:hypothetical protein